MASFLAKILRSNKALAILVLSLCFSPAYAGTGSVRIGIYKAGFIFGVSGGKGTLSFADKNYKLLIGGVSFGATVGASKAELVGEVYNINRPSDIEGTYSALQAGVAIAGGSKSAQLQNLKGVVLKLKGKQIGLEFSIDLSGMQISLK